jgi:PadR family transcriptional regulator PadR
MAVNTPKMTIPTQLVLEVLLTEPDHQRYGAEIGASAGLPSGTVHPILARLEGLGWLESEWENVDPAAVGRPARRYYRLTAFGVTSARAALANTYRAKAGLRALRPLGQS